MIRKVAIYITEDDIKEGKSYGSLYVKNYLPIRLATWRILNLNECSISYSKRLLKLMDDGNLVPGKYFVRVKRK